MSSADAQKALAQFKAVHDDRVATINTRDYVLLKMTHKNRRRVFAFYSSIGAQATKGDMSFLDSERFEAVEKIINQHVTFENDLIDKLPEHWEKYPGDYIPFVVTMLGAMSYPFMAAAPTS